jgi:hypothetical protein
MRAVGLWHSDGKLTKTWILFELSGQRGLATIAGWLPVGSWMDGYIIVYIECKLFSMILLNVSIGLVVIAC